MIRRSALTVLLCATLLAAPPRPAPDLVIHLAPGQVSPSQFKGKVVIVALIMTGCPHCQQTTEFLTGLQKEYASRGVQVLTAAFNEDAASEAPKFVQRFKPAFPVGWVTRPDVVKYLGKTKMDEIWVPVLVFIDRKGIIRYRHMGDDPFFKEGDKNIRAHVAELLK